MDKLEVILKHNSVKTYIFLFNCLNPIDTSVFLADCCKKVLCPRFLYPCTLPASEIKQIFKWTVLDNGFFVGGGLFNYRCPNDMINHSILARPAHLAPIPWAGQEPVFEINCWKARQLYPHSETRSWVDGLGEKVKKAKIINVSFICHAYRF